MEAIRNLRRSLWVALGLTAVVTIAHAGALEGTFHYDDLFTIVDNTAIRSWSPLAYVTSPSAGSSWQDASAYRPLTVASFAMNYAWGRLNPRGYLAVNLALHALLSWMVFILGRHLLNSEPWAALAALVFAVHPVNAEAVNYATARSSLLSALGATVTFWLFLRALTDGPRRWIWISMGSFALAAALLSKESAIVMVALLPAYAIVVHRDGRQWTDVRTAAWVIVPFAAVAAVYVIALKVVGGGRITVEESTTYPLWVFLEMMMRSLALWVWPVPLGLDHPLALLRGFDWAVATSIAVAGTALLAVIWWCRRRVPEVSFGLIWAVAGLLPHLPLAWITSRGLLQENRMVLSTVGLAWVSAVCLRAAWHLLGRVVPDARIARGIGVTAIVGLLIVAVGVDRWRSEVWQDDRTLWEEAVRHAPEYTVAQVNLGSTYLNAGDDHRAEAAFRRAVTLDPRHKTAHYNLGLLALRQGRYPEARESLQQALAVDPTYVKAYRALGALELESGNPEAGVAAFQQAAAINPQDPVTYAEFGRLAQRAGYAELAEQAFLQALGYAPANADVRKALGMVYLDRQRWEDAAAQFAAARRTDPDSIELAYNQAVALYRSGRIAEARAIVASVLPRIPPGEQFAAYRRTAQAILGTGGHPGSTPAPSR